MSGVAWEFKTTIRESGFHDWVVTVTDELDGMCIIARLRTKEEARVFSQALINQLKPFRWRARASALPAAIMQIGGCDTEFEVSLNGRMWAVTDDNGHTHSSRSLRKALQAGVMASGRRRGT